MFTQKEGISLYSNETMNSMSLGCFGCPLRPECGALFVPGSLYHCTDLCCQDPDKCNYACQNNISLFEHAFSEVAGLSLSTLPRTERMAVPFLRTVVPLIYHGFRRSLPLRSETVAVKLSSLIDPKTNRVKFGSKDEVATHFRFDPTANLVIMGVDKDAAIERIWSLGEDLGAQLWMLQPSLVTTPNYSTGFDVPRPEDVINIKRIAKTWVEFTQWDLAASLHVNARNDHDWVRWTKFIEERDEINSVTFEFRTAALTERLQWHVGKLISLAENVGRPLQLVVRGGRKHLPILAKHFDQVVFVDTSSFMATVNRYVFDWKPGRVGTWRKHPTVLGEPLDGLLQANIDLYATMVVHAMR